MGKMDGKAVNKRAIESLIKAGAADNLESENDLPKKRSRFLAEIEHSSRSQASRQKDIENGQGFLFGLEEIQSIPEDKKAETPLLTQAEVLKFEKEILGFYLSGHPLTPIKERLAKMATHSISALNPSISTPVRVAGIITQVKRMTTKTKGEPWARSVLEDLSGLRLKSSEWPF